jgi:UDP-N-acetylmuramoylalanine-D-glutamate ligase
MNHIKRFNEMKRYTKEGKSIITRDNEMNIIAYQIPNSDDFILGRTPDRKWVVQTSDGVMLYSTNEMEELYILDLIESDLERLTWTA